MRRRAFWVVLLAVASLAGCSRRSSLYMEPGKQDGAAGNGQAHAGPQAARR
jgi:hypothetical protein